MPKISHVKFFKNISKKDVGIAGGKGASLGEMTQAKIPVPNGFVVLASAFDRFLEETNLKEEITARLETVNMDDTNTIDRASNVIRDSIHDRPMPKDLEKEILVAFSKLKTKYVAVRSSATAEDSSVASWAGELESYLNTSKKDLLVRVRECWSSLYTPRAIFYRHEKGLVDHYVSVAVVVQKMVQSEVSGIVFTVHPVTEDYDQLIIEAGFGLGEAIVSGSITPDSYIVSKKRGEIVEVFVSEQEKKMVRGHDPKQKNIEEKNSANHWVRLGVVGHKQKLNKKQIISLAKICQKIEEHYEFPCDIEWAFEKKKFFITQSRPITTLKK